MHVVVLNIHYPVCVALPRKGFYFLKKNYDLISVNSIMFVDIRNTLESVTEPIFQWTLISPEEKQILAGWSPGLTLPLVEVNQAIDAWSFT